jgi:hypothetical protein
MFLVTLILLIVVIAVLLEVGHRKIQKRDRKIAEAISPFETVAICRLCGGPIIADKKGAHFVLTKDGSVIHSSDQACRESGGAL